MATLRDLLLFAGCATFSLYIFPAGGIQPAHAFLAMAAFVAFLSDRVHFSQEAAILLSLAAIAFGREACAVLSGAPLGMLAQPIYILFNMMVLVAVQTAYSQTQSIEPYKWGITVAIMLALGSLLITGINLTGTRIEERAIGTFQNPNQLAYFAAIMFSITALLYLFERISARTTALLVIAAILLALAAQSKAAYLGLSLGVSALLSAKRIGRVVAAIGAAAVIAMYLFGAVDFERLLFVQRLNDIGADPDDSFAARGYLILVESARNPLQVWFGLGAHGVRLIHTKEIHSTYASYFGLYGIVGGMLYLALLASWVRKLHSSISLSGFVAVVAPPLFYGIAHNGTRFSIFYALIGLSLALCEEGRASLRRSRITPVPGSLFSSDPVRSDRIRPIARIARGK